MKKNIWDEFHIWLDELVVREEHGVFWANVAAGAATIWLLGLAGVAGFWLIWGLYSLFQFSPWLAFAVMVLSVPTAFWLAFLATRETEE
jgi:hypothetical protein